MEKENSYRLITEAAKSIFTYCRARTNSREDAEDLSQDILLELLGEQGNLRDDKAFYGFMWAVAGNVYKNWCKKRKKLNWCELDDNVLDDNIPFPQLLVRESDLYLLHRELGLLAEQYRKVVIMYYFNDAKVATISKSLNITESMVKFLLFKSRKILKEGMNMERARGDLSYNPGCLKLCVQGEWPGYIDPTAFEYNLIAQNILLTCYYERCTVEEISLQIGVAVPYLEYHLNELCTKGVLIQKNKRYETVIVIFTKNFALETQAKTLPFQQQIADTIGQFLDEHLSDIKAVGFHIGVPDDGLLRWWITQLIIEQAVLEKNPNDLSFALQRQDSGRKYFTWGLESHEAQYGGLTCVFNNDNGDYIKFLEYFAVSFNERIFDFGYFMLQKKRIDLILDIAKGKYDGFNENEMLENAEFIKNGWIRKDSSALSLCVPVFTAGQFEQVRTILNPVTEKIAEITREIIMISTDILLQHTPASKKKEAKEIAWLKKHDIAMSAPVELMRNSGVLRRFSDNEHPSTYIVLK